MQPVYTARPIDEPQPLTVPVAQAAGRDAGRETIELRRQIERLEAEVSRLRTDGAPVPAAVKDYVKAAIEHFFRHKEEREREIILDQVQQSLKGLKAEFAQQVNALTEDLAVQRERVEALARLEQADDAERDETAQRDRFYAAMLGMLFGRSVEPLREGHFDALVSEAGEMLNKFFKDDLPRHDLLDELAVKTTALDDALRAVIERASRLTPDAKQQLLPLAAGTGNLKAELSKMQSQLRQRQLYVESLIHIPISAYEGARYTFLEQLGLSLKREIDKLRNPVGYFTREWERLVTRDLSRVVDACDTQVSKPGANNGLEAAFNALFSAAGLTCILPKGGEPYNPAEQNISRMVSGQPGSQQKIAGVVNRGFYYRAGGRERLLRKAKVEVYK